MYKKSIQTNRGFTLIELIVSLGLLIVVVTVSSTTLLSLTDINRKAQSLRTAFDNLNLALESMSRDIRTGVVYTCNPLGVATLSFKDSGNDCTITSGTSIAFLAANGKTVVYKKVGTAIQRSREGGSNFHTLTSPNVKISEFSVGVSGTTRGGDQPKVLMLIKGIAGTDEAQVSFVMQTSITQRMPDLP